MLEIATFKARPWNSETKKGRLRIKTYFKGKGKSNKDS